MCARRAIQRAFSLAEDYGAMVRSLDTEPQWVLTSRSALLSGADKIVNNKSLDVVFHYIKMNSVIFDTDIVILGSDIAQ